ncbi:MAG: hypothetical protein ABR986_11595 [Methanomassiliicoccales archaeon]|jgi:hypothetical protein
MSRRDNGAVIAMVASLPLMVYRLFRSYLRVKVSAKKASKEFYLSLLANGLPKREAKALRDEYGAGMSITSLIRRFAFRSR